MVGTGHTYKSHKHDKHALCFQYMISNGWQGLFLMKHFEIIFSLIVILLF